MRSKRNATPSARGWVVALADMPALKSATIVAIAQKLESGMDLVAPTYQGERGHPVGFGKRYGPQLLALDGDTDVGELDDDYDDSDDSDDRARSRR